MTCGAPQPPGGGGAAQASYQAAQHYQQPGQWGAPQQPQGYGAAQPQFGGAPMARPKQGDGKGLLIGCGAAGCLGIIGIIVVLFFVIGATGSSSSSDDGGKSAPSGRLKANVQKNVAGWKVKSTKPLEVSGSVDAIVVQYKKGGKLIEWAVAVFPTEERAQEHLLGVTRSVANDVPVSGEVVRIKDDKGREIGLGSHFESNPEFLCYRIGKLMAVISGPRGDVVPFFRELP